jgi:hypothetical protein
MTARILAEKWFQPLAKFQEWTRQWFSGKAFVLNIDDAPSGWPWDLWGLVSRGSGYKSS